MTALMTEVTTRWLALCQRYGLNPARATADELDAIIRRQAYAQAIIDMQTALSDLAKQSKAQ